MSVDAAATGLGRVDTLRPVSNELLTAVLDAHGYRYAIDDDGDVGGVWQDNVIFFLIGPEPGMLQIKGQARVEFTVDDVPRLHTFCNGWNHDRYWPKAYVHVYDDGLAAVFGEVCAYLPHGVAVEQLDQLIEGGISAVCQLADAITELP